MVDWARKTLMVREQNHVLMGLQGNGMPLRLVRWSESVKIGEEHRSVDPSLECLDSSHP